MSDVRKTLRPVHRRRNTQKVRRYRIEGPETVDQSSIPAVVAADQPSSPIPIDVTETTDSESIPAKEPPVANILLQPENTSHDQTQPAIAESASTEDASEDIVLEENQPIEPIEQLIPPSVDLSFIAAVTQELAEKRDEETTPPTGSIDMLDAAAAALSSSSAEEAEDASDIDVALAPLTGAIEDEVAVPSLSSEDATEPAPLPREIQPETTFTSSPPRDKTESEPLGPERLEPKASAQSTVIKGMPIRIITNRPPAQVARASEPPTQSEPLIQTGSQSTPAPAILETKGTPLALTETEDVSEEVTISESSLHEVNGLATHTAELETEIGYGTAVEPAWLKPVTQPPTEPLIEVDVLVETVAEEEAERTIRDEDLEPLPASLYPELAEGRPNKVERGNEAARESVANASLEAESDEKSRPRTSPALDAKMLTIERPFVPTPLPPIRSTPIPPPPQSSQTGARSTATMGPLKRPSGRPGPMATGALQVPSPPAKSARTSTVAASSTATLSAGTAKVQPPEATKRQTKGVRPWWERFFTDDYLRSVVLPSSQQVKRQCDFIESSLALAHGSTILDVGCGKGVHAIDLTTRGYLVVGLDLSLPMITRAAEDAQYRGLKINFLHADIREIAFDGAFDAVICMGTTFGFFDDEANRDVLARLYGALRPGGRLLLDVVNRDFVMGSQPNLVWFQGDGCVCMEESDFSYFTSRLQVKRTMMHEDGRQTEAEYSVRLYSLHELGWLLRQMGFRVLEVSGQEATRGMFFGLHAPRLVMLAERQVVTGENRNPESL